ncbi:MAG: hypothetical protein OIF50_04255 [Flavobacteriaceae bacterium]|nr:hypothetical protein [Flavobacteriaceae bacterium]
MKRNTDKDCKTMGAARHAPIKTICPWDKIPKEVIKNTGNEPIKKRTKSFEELENLALAGISYHWGRNRKHAVAKNVEINGEKYEVYEEAINTEKNTMDDVDLIFNTNRSYMGSSNPGSVTNYVDFFGQVVPERIVYNGGYIKHSNGWDYHWTNREDDEFKITAAHEIGHTILKAFGGVN